MRLRNLIVATTLLLLSPTVLSAQKPPMFKGKVKLPFALEVDSRRIEPGTYVITVDWREGQRVLVIATERGEVKARLNGDPVPTPPEQRDVKQQKRLQIQRQPAEGEGGKGLVIFHLDYKVGGQCCNRLTFRAEEAPSAGS